MERVAAGPAPWALKGQITGPFTLLTGLCDQDKRLGYYSDAFREMAVKALALKAAWQTRFLAERQVPVMVFIDEPALAGLGSSAFISIAKDDIAADINEVAGAIRAAGGRAGVHVCANTDWPFVLGLEIDIISFDAHGYFDRFATCREEVTAFLDRGGVIAWGLVPTSDLAAIDRESADHLAATWEQQAGLLTGGTWDREALLARTLVTPSCGTGAMDTAHARRVLQLTHDLSALLRGQPPTTNG